MFKNSVVFILILILSLMSLSGCSLLFGRKTGVEIFRIGDRIRIDVNGKMFTEYYYQNVPRPFFYPVIGPTGVAVNRHWPLQDINEDEAKDHPHHKSLWFTHGEINGENFWGEGETAGRIVHDDFVTIRGAAEAGIIKSKNKYVAKSGKIVCTDTRTHIIYNRPEGPVMDWIITVHASNGEVTFGDTKEGSMAIRLAPTMRLKGKVAQGHIVNSEGDRDGETWGKRAAWCDYYGPVAGRGSVEDRTVGVAIFDHPDNPKHPTWWHVRDYGLFAANPFGVHDFEKKTKGVGDIVIPDGESLTFKYRFYFHKGDEKQGEVAEHWADFAANKVPR